MAKRKSAAQIAAREEARALQAQFDVLVERRLDIATRAVAMRKELAEFDDKTEELVAELIAKRTRKRSEIHAQLGALTVEMTDTKVNKSEAAGRLGMSLSELNAARRAFDEAVRVRAEAPGIPALPVSSPSEAVSLPASGTASPEGLQGAALPIQGAETGGAPVTGDAVTSPAG